MCAKLSWYDANAETVLFFNRTWAGAASVFPPKPIRFGVPQGFILDPQLFILYNADLSNYVTYRWHSAVAVL